MADTKVTKAEINEIVKMLNQVQGEILAYTEHACELIDGCIAWLDEQHEDAEWLPSDWEEVDDNISAWVENHEEGEEHE